MNSSIDDKDAYIAIGDAVLQHIERQQEISRESLIRTLDQQAMGGNNDELHQQMQQGRSLLSDVTDASE